MQAIQIATVGGPEVLRAVELPLPTPRADEALVQLMAIGVNFIDVYKRTGHYSVPLPFVPGEEGSGVVVATGLDVATVKVGDRVVFAGVVGAYADYIAIPADQVVPVPDGITFTQAAAALFQGMTAHYLTHSAYPLQAGETALVHAAAGGVGRLLVQMAKLRGARVIGTVSTPVKAQLAYGAGADEAILYTEQDFVAATRAFTAGKGVDVVYDSVGRTTFDQSLACLRPRGMLVIYGQSSGAVPPFDVQRLNAYGSLLLTRPTLAHFIAERDELLWRAGDVFSWVANGQLDVHVGATYPLVEAARAQSALAGRATTGKVLLIPAGFATRTFL
jgi:NADPH2:quinone reductase